MATTGQLRPPRQDDVLECFLYPKFCFSSNPEQVTEELLVEEIAKFSQVIDKYTNNYIWHRESLVLRPRTKQALLLDRVLEGSTVTDGESNVVKKSLTCLLIYNQSCKHLKISIIASILVSPVLIIIIFKNML